MKWLPFLFLSLSACQPSTIKLGDDTSGIGNDSSTDSQDSSTTNDTGTTVIDDTGTTAAADFVLTAINPGYGPVGGGTTVTLKGGPFNNGVKVGFGTKVATVVSVANDTLVVTSPAQSAEGPVDVVAIQDGKQAALPDGFAYYDDLKGKAAYLGTVAYIHNLNQDLGGDSAYTWTYLLNKPAAFSYWELYAPKLESCQSNYSAWPAAKTLTNPADVTLTPAAQPKHQVPWDANQGIWYDGALGNAFVENTSYDMTFPAVDAWPASLVSKAVTTPSAFSITEPNFSRDTPYLDVNDFRIRWSGNGGTAALISVTLYDSRFQNVVETVTCAVNDDGDFTIPEKTWQNWDTYMWAVVSVTRDIEGSASLPFNNGLVRMAGTYSVQGIGYTGGWGG